MPPLKNAKPPPKVVAHKQQLRAKPRAPAPKKSASPAQALAAELAEMATGGVDAVPAVPAKRRAPRRRAGKSAPREDHDPVGEPSRPEAVIVSPHLPSPELRAGASARQPSPSATPSRHGCRLADDLVAKLQRLHLVIDLDATFVSSHLDSDSCRTLERVLATASTPEEIAAVQELKRRIVYFTLDKQRVFTILRPGSIDFLDFASMYFKSVNVWSAGDREYVNEIVAILFPPHIARPGVIFNRNDCRAEAARSGKSRAASPSNRGMKYFSKPLSEFIKHSTSDHTLSNTIMLDDREDIAVHNPENLIQIKEYEFDLEPKQPGGFKPHAKLLELIATDSELEQLTDWLLERDVIEADDIRTVDKSRARIFPCAPKPQKRG